MKKRVLFLITFIFALNLSLGGLTVHGEENVTSESTALSNGIQASDNSTEEDATPAEVPAASEDGADASSENTQLPDVQAKTYTISYGKGIYISYAGSEPKNFIKGDPPSSQTVAEGGNIAVAENTFTFRDYSFGGWKYTYTTSSGEKKTKYYPEGSVIENVTGDMKLEATWTKKNDNLKIGAFTVYADTNEKTANYIGEIIVLKEAPDAPDPSYTFCGWTDKDGTVLYSALDSYEIKSINTVIKPVWSKNGEQINYKKLSVSVFGNGKASVSEIYLLTGTSMEIKLTPDEGCKLSAVKINGVSVDASETLTVKIENEDVSVEAVFEQAETLPDDSLEDEKTEFTVTVLIISGKGKVSPERVTVSRGEDVTLTFTPEENYTLPHCLYDNGKEKISDDDKLFGRDWDGVYTIKNISEDHEIKIEFFSKNGIVDISVLDPDSPMAQSDSNNQNSSDSSGFTATMCVIILALAVIFGIVAVKMPGKPKDTKNRRKK